MFIDCLIWSGILYPKLGELVFISKAVRQFRKVQSDNLHKGEKKWPTIYFYSTYLLFVGFSSSRFRFKSLAEFFTGNQMNIFVCHREGKWHQKYVLIHCENNKSTANIWIHKIPTKYLKGQCHEIDRALLSLIYLVIRFYCTGTISCMYYIIHDVRYNAKVSTEYCILSYLKVLYNIIVTRLHTEFIMLEWILPFMNVQQYNIVTLFFIIDKWFYHA